MLITLRRTRALLSLLALLAVAAGAMILTIAVVALLLVITVSIAALVLLGRAVLPRSSRHLSIQSPLRSQDEYIDAVVVHPPALPDDRQSVRREPR